MFKFLKAFTETKIEDAGEALAGAIVRYDTEGATEATIKMMDDNLNQILKEAGQARVEHGKEQREADEIVKLYNQRLQGAENLQNQIAEAGDDATKVASLSTSLGNLLGLLEEMGDDVEREKQEAIDAKEMLDELEATAAEAADTLKDARTELKKAKQGMQKAQLAEERARKKAKRAELASGIRSKTGGINTAIEAMQKRTDDAKASADASTMKARLLKPTGGLDEDPNITAAMGGGEDTSTMSIQDRLAALKK